MFSKKQQNILDLSGATSQSALYFSLFRRKGLLIILSIVFIALYHVATGYLYHSSHRVRYISIMEIKVDDNYFKSVKYKAKKKDLHRLPDVSINAIYPKLASQLPGAVKSEKVAYLQKRILVAPFLKNNIRLILDTNEKRFNLLLTNTLLEHYRNDFNARLSKDLLSTSAESKNLNLKELNSRLKNAKDMLHDFYAKHNDFVDAGLFEKNEKSFLSPAALQSKLNNLKSERDQATEAIKDDFLKLTFLKEDAKENPLKTARILKSDYDVDVSDIILSEVGKLDKAITKYHDKGYQDTHPDLSKKLAAKNTLIKSISTNNEKVLSDLISHKSSSSLPQKAVEINRLLGQDTQAIFSEYIRLATLIQAITQVQQELSQRMHYKPKVFRTASKIMSKEFRVLSISEIKKKESHRFPIKPNMQLSIVIGTLLGALATLSIARNDENVHNATEMKEILQFPVLTIIPDWQIPSKDRLPDDRPELCCHQHPRSPTAEAFRLLKIRLKAFTSSQQNQSILVTSSYPDEGKTIVASNLAIILAQTGKKVLLLDFDLRKAVISDIYRSSEGKNFNHYIHSSIELPHISKTKVDNLFMISSQPTTHNSAQIFESPKFDKLMEYAKSNFHYIICDSPPTLPIIDVALIAKKCDATIIVAMADKTTKSNLQKTTNIIINSGGQLIGTVLNKFKP